MAGDQWLVFETLDPSGEFTMIAEGDARREWTGPLRLRRDAGRATADRIAETLRRCADSGETEIDSGAGGAEVIAEPIVCAFGSVHGVHVWAGPSDRPRPPRRRVAAWDFLSRTELAYHGPGLEELVFARASQDVRVERTPPEAFGAMVRFDGRVEYTAMVAGADPSGRWQGEVDMRGDDGLVRRFQMVARVHGDDGRVTRALMHDVSDSRPYVPDAEVIISRFAARGYGVGYVELATAQLYEWVGAPPPPLDRWRTERPEFHPDDLPAYRAVCREMFDGAPGSAERELSFRVRFAGSDWIAVHAVLTRFGEELPHGLIRVQPAPPG